jgi:hypothetical protein
VFLIYYTNFGKISFLIVLQDEKDSESKCEVLLVKEPICISSDFVNASSKLGPFQDTG